MNELKKILSPKGKIKEILISMAGFFLAVGAYFFTDSDKLKMPLPALAIIFLLFGMGSVVKNRIDFFGRTCIYFWFCVPFLLMDIVMVLLFSVQSYDFLQSIMVKTDLLYRYWFRLFGGNIYEILRWIILNLVITISGDIILMMQVYRIQYEQKEKVEFTQREGILLGIYFLLRIYQMLGAVCVLTDTYSGKFCPDTFIYMPLILCIWMSVRGCQRMIKESRKFKRFLTIITLSMLIILLIGICSSSFFLITGGEEIIKIRYELREIEMKASGRYLYMVMDILFLLFAGLGLLIGIYTKKISKIFPPVRSIMILGMVLYILYTFTLPEYRLMKAYWERPNNTPPCIINADVGPIIIEMVEDEEWSWVLEYIEQNKRGEFGLTPSDHFFKYYWIVNYYNDKYENGYGIGYSYERTNKMLEEKLAEAKKLQEEEQ